MAYDLEEQEQLASLKAWWNQYGNMVTWLLTLCLAAYAAWNGWNYYQRSQTAQASQLFDELQKAVTAKDGPKVQRAATDLKEKFGGTVYAPMAALSAAKTAFDANDAKTAKAHLQWVVGHGGTAEFTSLAKVRLAGLLLDEKAYDEGLKLLAGDFPPAFSSAVADRKGDLLVAQNKLAEARAAYLLALGKSDDKNPGRPTILLKLEAIGGEEPKPAASASASASGQPAA